MLDSFRLDHRYVTWHTWRWRQTSRDSAGFVGTVKKINDSVYFVRDYFISGEPQMTGVYITHDSVNWKRRGMPGWDSTAHPKRTGKWVWWNRSGMINRIRDYGDDAEYPYESFDFVDPLSYLQVPDSVTIRNTGAYEVRLLWKQQPGDKAVIDEDIYDQNGAFLSTNWKKIRLRIGRFQLVIKGDKVYTRRGKPGGGVRSQFSTRPEKIGTLSYPCSMGLAEMTAIASPYCSLNYSLLINRMDQEEDLWISGFSAAELFILDKNGDHNDELYLLGSYRCGKTPGPWMLLRITPKIEHR